MHVIHILINKKEGKVHIFLKTMVNFISGIVLDTLRKTAILNLNAGVALPAILREQNTYKQVAGYKHSNPLSWSKLKIDLAHQW